MVKLNQEFKPRGDPNPILPRNHHNWGSRLGRNREERKDTEPRNLLELEELAQRTVKLMEKHGSKSEHNFQIAMELLRCQYNLNFIMICERCNGPHINDELLAPER